MVKETTHSLLDILSAASPSRMALPLNEAIIDPVKARWQTPASLPPTAKRTECKYFVSAKDMSSSSRTLPQGSLVVAAANERDHRGEVGSICKGKDSKKLDLFGWKIYSMGGAYRSV